MMPADAPLLMRWTDLVAAYRGWTYHRTNVGCVHGLGAMPVSVRTAPYRATNCSTFVADVVMALYPDAGWTGVDYGDLQVFSDRLPTYPDAPIRALRRRMVGRQVDGPMGPGVYVCQAWAARWAGHVFFVVVGEGEPERLLVVDANVGRHRQAVRATWATLGELQERYPYDWHWARLLG